MTPSGLVALRSHTCYYQDTQMEPITRAQAAAAPGRQDGRMRGGEARYAAMLSAPPGGTRSKGSRTLTIVPVPSDPDGTIVPPS
jgi:hypothetical protein